MKTEKNANILFIGENGTADKIGIADEMAVPAAAVDPPLPSCVRMRDTVPRLAPGLQNVKHTQ